MSICAFCGNVVDPGKACPVCDHVAPLTPTKSYADLATEKSSSAKTPSGKTSKSSKVSTAAKASRSTKASHVARGSRATKGSRTISEKPDFLIWFLRLLSAFGFLYFARVNLYYFNTLSLRSLLSLSGIIRFALIIAIGFFSLLIISSIIAPSEETATYLLSHYARRRTIRSLIISSIVFFITLGIAERINGYFLTNGFLVLRILALIFLFVYITDGFGYRPDYSSSINYLFATILCDLFSLTSVLKPLERFSHTQIQYSESSYYNKMNWLGALVFLFYIAILCFLYWGALDRELHPKKEGEK